VIIYCKICKDNFTIKKYEYICPSCGGGNVKIVDGEELLLMQLEME